MYNVSPIGPLPHIIFYLIKYYLPFHMQLPRYQWKAFESAEAQCDRMEKVVQQLAREHPDETVVIVPWVGL